MNDRHNRHSSCYFCFFPLCLAQKMHRIDDLRPKAASSSALHKMISQFQRLRLFALMLREPSSRLLGAILCQTSLIFREMGSSVRRKCGTATGTGVDASTSASASTDTGVGADASMSAGAADASMNRGVGIDTSTGIGTNTGTATGAGVGTDTNTSTRRARA